MNTMNTVSTGNQFEARVLALLREELEAGGLAIDPKCSSIFPKRRYFSRDRCSDIIFDISIEVYMPGAADYSFLFLIECKDYNSPVPVNDIEEFFAKVQQVGAANSKAIVASTAPFQKAGLEFARSKGIGLLRVSESSLKWELRRAARRFYFTATALANDSLIVESADFNATHSRDLQFVIQTPSQITNDLSRLFLDLLQCTDGAQPPSLFQFPGHVEPIHVQHLSKEELEGLAKKTLVAIGHEDGVVDLDALCKRENARCGLEIRRIPSTVAFAESLLLGRSTFNPPVIELFAHERIHPERERFTLAHELAHHILDHGRYLNQECCDENDLLPNWREEALRESVLDKLEFQANYLAGALLMPRDAMRMNFARLAAMYDIVDKGRGPLYVDDQPCNLETFDIVSRTLAGQFGTSRAAISVRLKQLGILNDVRTFIRPQLHLALR